MRPSPKLISVLRWFLFSCAAAGTLLAAFIAIENWRGNRAWRMKEAQFAAEGEALDLAALRPVPVLDQENFFKAPLLARILYKQAGDRERESLLADSKLSGLFAEVQHFGHKFKDFASLREQLSRKPWLDVPATGSPAADLLVALKPLQPLLDDLREAGRHRPKAALDCGDTPLAAARVEINSVFCLSMMLGFRARLELELGQIDEAYADIVALQKLANGFAADPINLVHLLVGISMHGTAAEVVNDGCRKHAWTHAHLGRFQELLGELRPVAGFRNAMRSERAGVLYCIDHSPQTPALGVDWPWWLFPGWVQQNKLVYCRDLEERILVRLQPGAHRVLARPQNASPVSTAGKAGLTSPYRWLTRLCLSNLEGILENAAVAAEKLNLNLTAWAVERYRLAHGEYPRDLAVLVPAFIAQRPQGVLNGLPISFQRMSAKKLKIYSVGWDACDDDGGKDDVGIEITG